MSETGFSGGSFQTVSVGVAWESGPFLWWASAEAECPGNDIAGIALSSTVPVDATYLKLVTRTLARQGEPEISETVFSWTALRAGER